MATTVIIRCADCESIFDVTGMPSGASIKCGKCKALLEVPKPGPAQSSARHPVPVDVLSKRRPRPVEEVPDESAARKKTSRDKEARGKTGKVDRPKDRGKTGKIDRAKDRGRSESNDVDERRNKTDQRRKTQRRPRERGETEARRKTTRRAPAGSPKSADRKGGQGAWPIYLAAFVLLVAGGAGALLMRGGSSGKGGEEAAQVSQLEKEFEARYEAAGSQPDKLFDVADWCQAKSFEGRRTEILRRILRLEPDHLKANEALGLVQHGGKWVTRSQRSALLTASENKLKPVEFALGKALTHVTAGRFEIYAQRSGMVEQEKLDSLLTDLKTKLEAYFTGFYERNADDLREYSGRRYGAVSQLPKLTLAIFTEDAAYRAYAAKVRPRAEEERGFYDAERKQVVLVYDGSESYAAPFYDSFLMAVYKAPFVKKSEKRNPNEEIVWEKGLASFGYLGKDVHVSLTDHFLVAVQTGKGYSALIIADQYARLLETLYATFQKDFAEVIAQRSKMSMMPIYVFRERKDYVKYGDAKNSKLLRYAGGHYEPKNRIMMTFQERQRRDTTVLHEGTHLLMHYLSGFREKKVHDLFWFQEGIADYFAGFTNDRETGKLVLGHPNEKRLERFQSKVARGPQNYLRLADLVKYNQLRWHNVVTRGDPRTKHAKMLLIYEQGWAFSHFLMHSGNGKYRKPFLAFINRALTSGQTYQDFMECFGGSLDWDTMEREFREHVMGLRL